MSWWKKLFLFEPSGLSAGLKVITLAILNLGAPFDWWHWSSDQWAAVNASILAIFALFDFITRALSTPTEKLKQMQEKIDEQAKGGAAKA